MKGKILVGTASWSDPGFVADWYPKGLPASERLPYYAHHFHLVELNSSFYAIPSWRNVERWCSQTPSDFVFDVKLHKFLSRHSAGPESLPPDLRKKVEMDGKKLKVSPKAEGLVLKAFLREIKPFDEAGKLGALLLQLSPGFSPRSHKLEELSHILEMLQGKKVAVELRNRGWAAGDRLKETFAFFEKHKAALVAVDAPASEHFMVMPYLDAVTTPKLAYMRLHGRNTEGYIRGRTVAARFDYDYKNEEVAEHVAKAKTLAKDAAEVHVVYNNNALDYAPKAAARFAEMLKRTHARKS